MVKECNWTENHPLKVFMQMVLMLKVEYAMYERRKLPILLLFENCVITSSSFENDLHGGKTLSFVMDMNEEGCSPKKC